MIRYGIQLREGAPWIRSLTIAGALEAATEAESVDVAGDWYAIEYRLPSERAGGGRWMQWGETTNSQERARDLRLACSEAFPFAEVRTKTFDCRCPRIDTGVRPCPNCGKWRRL